MKAKVITVGEVCEVQNGFAFDAKYFGSNPQNGFPLIRIRDILNGYTKTYYSGEYDSSYIVHRGDFLIGMDGDFNIGQWKSEDALLNQRVCRLIPSNKVLSKFIYYCIPVALKAINENTSYATVKHLSSKQVKAITIPALSLSEQQRIVDILDQEFEKIDRILSNATVNLQNAKALYQAVLSVELTKNAHWPQKTVGELSSLITKGASPKWQGINYVQDKGVIFITSENVREGYLLLSPPKYVEERFNEKQARSILRKDDVLVNIVGASIGRSAVYDLEHTNANINQAVALIRCNQDILPKYLCQYLNSCMAFNLYEGMKKDTARANLSLANISDIILPVPSISEQMAILCRLDEISKKCRALQDNFNKTIVLCDNLKTTLLRKAYNGEL